MIITFQAVGSTYYFNTDPPYVIRKNDKNILIDGRDALRRRDPNLLTLMEEIYPCGNTIVQRCSYKGCVLYWFVMVNNTPINNCFKMKL